MADVDLYSLINAGEPTAQEQANAYAQALRRQRDNAQTRQDLGLLLQFSGDKVLSPAGQGLISSGQGMAEQAQHQQDQLGQAPVLRQALALHQQQFAKGQAELAAADQRRTALGDPTSVLSQTRAALAKRFGMTVADGTPGSSIDDKELDLAEKATQAEENRRMREAMARASAGQHNFQHEEKANQYMQKREDTQSKALDDVLNANKVKGGLKGYSDTIARVKQAMGQVLDPATGQLKSQLDSRQMAELAITLQQAVANGHASEGEVEMLIPKTAWGNVAKAQEFFTGHPADTGQQAIALKMLHSAQNAADVAHGQIIDSYRQNIAGPLMGLRSIQNETARKRADATLRRHGINPDAIDDDGNIVDGVPFELPGKSAAGGSARVEATHYLISPDKKSRVAAGPDGKPLPGAAVEPNPAYQPMAARGLNG